MIAVDLYRNWERTYWELIWKELGWRTIVDPEFKEVENFLVHKGRNRLSALTRLSVNHIYNGAATGFYDDHLQILAPGLSFGLYFSVSAFYVLCLHLLALPSTDNVVVTITTV